MGDQNKNSADPSQGIQMQDFNSVSMAGSGPVPGTMTMTQSQCIPGLPTLAPAPPGPHPHSLQTSQIQQIHPGQHPSPQQSIAGQPMAIQPPLGQPQFHVIQQPFPGQQYATFPQFAYANQQGTVVLQPAQFSIPGGPGQPQGQQVILTGVPQKPGQPQMISTSQTNPGKGGQPSYTITSSGQIQMPGPGPQPQQTFMLTNPMGPGIQGPVSMTGPNGQTQTIHTSIAGMKDSEGKPVQCQPPQLGGQPNPQQPQFVIPSQGMTYMQAGPHPILQNGQIIFRTPAPPEQVMFSPSGQTHAQPQPPVQHPTNMSNSNSPMGNMAIPGPGVRPTIPVGPPPGKTAISRSIAPLLPNVSQTNARIGYATGNPQGQPSPKSKQKMSPRGPSGGLGRPPAPKGGNLKMLPRMAGAAATGPPIPGSPGSPSSPRPPLQLPPHTNPTVIGSIGVGPPTLSPMTVTESLIAPPTSLPSTTVTTISHTPKAPIMSSVSSAPPTKLSSETSLDPPTLTKEISTPVSSQTQQNVGTKPLSTLAGKPVSSFLSTDNDQGLVPTPKAVVKPHVLTHVIDGHLIKESSQPFPVSPVKATARRKPEKPEDKTLNPVPVKRGPGRPPGSTKSNENLKNGVEPPEKKLKTKENLPISAPQAPFLTSSQPVQPPQPPASVPSQPQQLPPQPQQLSSLRSNPLKWNVTEVCDFIKALPGCGEYVEDFAQQEIDGQALMLLKADHLMTAMSIKLGPALKICSHIEQLREELNKN